MVLDSGSQAQCALITWEACKKEESQPHLSRETESAEGSQESVFKKKIYSSPILNLRDPD